MPFDGADNGVFCSFSHIAYSCDLLNFWLYKTAGSGRTFRDTYETSIQFARFLLALLRRSTASLQCNLRCASVAFYAFLRTISPPEAEILTKLFSCETCENEVRLHRNAIHRYPTGERINHFLMQIALHCANRNSFKLHLLKNITSPRTQFFMKIFQEMSSILRRLGSLAFCSYSSLI